MSQTEEFYIDGNPVTLTVPAQAAPGTPWLWVAEFAGHLEQFEDALVNRGWHVAAVQLCDQYGSSAAMTVWEKLYAELHGVHGFSARPALLGISRGGLYVNAWTRLHPDRVSILYLDNGVCDPRCWPYGCQLTRQGMRSDADVERYKELFHFASDEEALEKSVHPLDGMMPAINAGIFLVSVHGTADPVVAYEDNAKMLVDFWQTSGGRYRIFAKEGGGHHPHGLPDATPLIDLFCSEVKKAHAQTTTDNNMSE
jgi:pimeloyl-ACP methyl ester carboxylesterase